MGLFGYKEEKEVTYDEYDAHNGKRASNDVGYGEVHDNADNLHRRLNNRQIQLIAIGGSIGTALFVSIGTGLNRGGPGSLFIAFTLYSFLLAAVNNCMAEMGTLYPVSGGFVRTAGKFVDDAWGFMAGWNFFLYEALLIPFEITALITVLGFWRDDITGGAAAAVIAICIVLYALINVLAVRAYGEAEFWLSGGKFVLIVLLFCFTFITMVGGNPQGDAYGFRYWENPGAFNEYTALGSTGNLARFEGFLAALFGTAAFTVVGPEYISMVAAEAKRPRIYIKTAFKTVYWRFGIFFILGALCVGIVCASNDPQLEAVLDPNRGGGSGTAAASPYVIAMRNLGISILPSIVNALLVTSIFSAGNTYTYAATRSLYSLALEGRAPRILTKTTKSGVPILCFAVTMCFPFLAFMQLGSGAADVLGWFIALITAGGIINYIVMTSTYLCFYRACKAQGLDRKTFPYFGRFQPWCGIIGLVGEVLIVIFFGYRSFRPSFSVETFFGNYIMVILDPILFFGWKLVKRTKFRKPSEVDLVWERPVIDAYEASFLSPPVGFWTEMGQMIGIKRKQKDNMRSSSVANEAGAPMDEKR